MAEHFQFLTRDDFRLLAEKAKQSSHQNGEVILAEGDDVPGIYVVRSGRVSVEKRFTRVPVRIATLDVGDVFGEVSFVDGYPASASVVAREETTVHLFERAQIIALLASVPGFAARFYQSLSLTLSDRLRNTTNDLADV